jgi:hypothetical protein
VQPKDLHTIDLDMPKSPVQKQQDIMDIMDMESMEIDPQVQRIRHLHRRHPVKRHLAKVGMGTAPRLKVPKRMDESTPIIGMADMEERLREPTLSSASQTLPRLSTSQRHRIWNHAPV